MEQLSMYMSERMVMHGIISEADKLNYCYSIQMLLEKVVGMSLILISAAYFHILLQTVAFLVVFVTIRRFSNGVHCRSSAGCFCASVLMCLSTSFIAPLLNSDCAMCMGVALAMVVLCIIATANNPDMNLTEAELHHLKKLSRITVLVTGGILMIIILIFPQSEFVSYMALGVIYNAGSLLIAILKGRREQCDDYNKT